MRVDAPARGIYRVRYVARAVAAGLYADYAEEILALKPQDAPFATPTSDAEEQVRLVEAWHLPDDERDPEPSIPGSRGAWVFACGDLVIDLKEWKRPRFPCVRMPYFEDVMGGYSMSLGEMLMPLQLELNKIKRRKMQGLALHAIPRMLRQAGSRISPEMQTEMGIIYEYSGAKPEILLGPSVAPEITAEEQNLISQMYQQAGISPLERGSDMPSRMDSRPGMREYIAAADEKHALASEAWSRSFLEAAQCIIDVARDIVEEEGEYESFGAAKDFVERIKFTDITLEDERFRIKLQNTNLLPTTPTGKRLVIQDLLKAGAFQSPEQMWTMIAGDHPDVDAMLSRKTAGIKLVEKQMYSIVSKRKYFPPDTHQDCEYAWHVAQDTVSQIILKNGAAEYSDRLTETIADLDKYILACKDILAQQTQAAADSPGAALAAGGSPNGAPAIGPGPAQPAQPAAPAAPAGPVAG